MFFLSLFYPFDDREIHRFSVSSPAVEFDAMDPQVVTDWWIEWCIYEDRVVDPFAVFGGRPLRFVKPFPGENFYIYLLPNFWLTSLEKIQMGISIELSHPLWILVPTSCLPACAIIYVSFARTLRCFIVRMDGSLFACTAINLSSTMRRSSTTHVIGNGKRAQEARKWNIPVVELDWIIEIARASWPSQRLDSKPLNMGASTSESDRKGKNKRFSLAGVGLPLLKVFFLSPCVEPLRERSQNSDYSGEVLPEAPLKGCRIAIAKKLEVRCCWVLLTLY
jgi:hypothetical protein